MNLVVNARDAMPQGGRSRSRPSNRELDGASRRRPNGVRAGPYVALAVQRHRRRHGRRPTQARVFEPFFTTKDAGQGHRAGPLHGVRHRAAERRHDHAWRARPAAARRSPSSCPRTSATSRRPHPRWTAAGCRGRNRDAAAGGGRGRGASSARRLLERQGYSVLEAQTRRRRAPHRGGERPRRIDLVSPTW